MTRRERLLAIGVGATVGVWALLELVVDPAAALLDQAAEKVIQVEGDYLAARGLVDQAFRVQKKWRGYQHAGLDETIATERLLMQQLMTRWAADSRVTLTTLSAGGVIEEAGLQQVRLTATLNGSLENMLAFVAEVEDADLPLAILSFDLSRPDTRGDDVTVRLILSAAVMPDAVEESA